MKDHRAILLSLSLHLFLILALFLKMPSSPRRLEFPHSIPVSIVSIGKITQSPKAPPVSAPQKPEYKAPPKEKKEVKKPEIKKSKLPEKSFFQKVKSLVPKKEIVPLKPKTRPKKTEAQVQKTPQPKVKETVEKKEDMFDSILDSMKDFKKETPKPNTPPTLNFEVANIADKLTLSELDALRQQLRAAWYIPVGVAEENTIVEVRVEISPEGRVKKVTVLNEAQGAKKKFFQAAVDSVKQALFSPDCTPLKLPKDRYDEWKVSIFVFSPEGVL